MIPETRKILRSYLAFWKRFRRDVAQERIQANSRIHWPHVGAQSVIVCDFASKEAALERADAMILEIQLRLYDPQQ